MASAAEGNGSPAVRRRYWRWSKADFFPEPSFRSWRAYGGALASTFPRFRDRVGSRSSDAVEAGTLLAQSENPLRRCLSWVDLAFLGFGSVVGWGVFVLTGQEARFDAGPAIPLAYAAAGFSALLSSFCYAELATEIPSAGDPSPTSASSWATWPPSSPWGTSFSRPSWGPPGSAGHAAYSTEYDACS